MVDVTGDELVLRAELRQEAAEEGRMAMRARIAGADPRHYDLDQTYYQRLSEGHQVRYPSAEHAAIHAELGGDLPRVAAWPVGAEHDRRVAHEQRRAEQAFVDSLKATAESLVWGRDTTRDADPHARTHMVLNDDEGEPYIALSRGDRSAGWSM